MSEIEETLKIKIEELLKTHGVELVELKVFSQMRSSVIRCLVDYPQGGISVEVCGSLNKKIVSLLEASSLLGDDFTVEVNSPGLDRPLKSYKDFVRSHGKYIGVWLLQAIDGKAYWEGKITQADENEIELNLKDKVMHIAMFNIKLGKEKITL
jgi:ribosome maturation factor RimP